MTMCAVTFGVNKEVQSLSVALTRKRKDKRLQSGHMNACRSMSCDRFRAGLASTELCS